MAWDGGGGREQSQASASSPYSALICQGVLCRCVPGGELHALHAPCSGSPAPALTRTADLGQQPTVPPCLGYWASLVTYCPTEKGLAYLPSWPQCSCPTALCRSGHFYHALRVDLNRLVGKTPSTTPAVMASSQLGTTHHDSHLHPITNVGKVFPVHDMLLVGHHLE